MRSSTALTRVLPIVAGVVLLGLLAFFAIGLPKLGAADLEDALPDTLPGGWTAVDEVEPPEASQGSEDYAESQREAIDYVQGVYADVLEEDTAFRAYTTESLDSFVIVTVFDAPGGAFAPPNGVADPESLGLERSPTELVRQDDAVCVLSWPSSPEEADGDVPLATSCQRAAGERTVQIASQGLPLDETIDLLDDVDAAIA